MLRFHACLPTLGLLSVVLAGCGPEPPARPPSAEQLAGAVYSGIYDEPLQLDQGQYEGEPFVPGGASRPTVRLLERPVSTGELNGEAGDEAAVLLLESSGGSGSFIYLAVVGLQDGEPVSLGTALVGDRSQVQGMTIEDSRVRLELLEHGPQDPACCPSRPVTQSWVLADDRLTLVGDE